MEIRMFFSKFQFTEIVINLAKLDIKWSRTEILCFQDISAILALAKHMKQLLKSTLKQYLVSIHSLTAISRLSLIINRNQVFENVL